MKLRRNRIVIDLDKARADQQGRASARRSGRAGRILGIIAVVLVLIIIGVAAGAYFWWRQYQTSHAYSLALLADAAQRNDTATMDGLLDYDSIINSVVKIGPLSPSVPTKIKQSLQSEVDAEAKRISERAAGKPFVLIALAVPRYADVKQEENVAKVTLDIQNERTQLTMQRDGDRWRVVAVQNDNLITQLLNAASRKLQR